MASNINVTEDENSIDINDINVFTVHVKDLSTPGQIQISEDSSEITEDTVDTTTEIRTIELPSNTPVNISVNEINSDTVSITTTNTNVIEVSDNISIVTAASEAASRQLRGFTGDSLWNQFGNNATYTQGNVGIGTNSPNVKLEVSGDVQATSFTGTFIGALSSSAQIAAEISGAFAPLAATVSTNTATISINTENINANTSNISNSILRLSAIENVTGSLSQSIYNNTSAIAGNLILINNQVEVSRSLQTRVSAVEAGSTSKTLISGSVQIANEISGAFNATSHSLQNRVNILEDATVILPDNLISGSAQIATEISGAFNLTSASLQTRLTAVEAGSTSKTLISGSSQIATEISGAFTLASASLQSRISIVETVSSSFSTRVTDLELTSSNRTFNHITASGNIAGGNIHASGSIKVKINDEASITLGSYADQGELPNITTENGKSLFIQGEGGGRLVQFGSDVIPSAGSPKDLGSPTRQWDKLHVNEVSASTLRTDNDAAVGGDLTVDGVVFGLQGFGVTIDDISITTGSTQFGSSSIDTHGFTGSMSVTGSLTVTGSVSANSFKGVFVGALSSSAQIANEITGAFIETSHSLQLRANSLETKISELDNALISGSSQIATEISGAFTVVSSSITNRVGNIETKISELDNTLISGSSQIATEITGAFTEISTSFEGRITTVETELSNTLISGSSQLATEISGAFTETSHSLQVRIANVEAGSTSKTLISGSAQIANEISGAFNNINFDSSTGNKVVVYDELAKRFYYTGSYPASVDNTSIGTTTQYALSELSTPVNLSKLIINDFSDTVSVNTDGGVLELTFGTPTNPYFSSFVSDYNADRFNIEAADYKLDINLILLGQSFVKGELSASTNNAAFTGVTTFNENQDVNINSDFPTYHSGSHTFLAKVDTFNAFGSPLQIESTLVLELNKSLPADPTITFTGYNITSNAYNEEDMEIELGAVGSIAVNVQEGSDNGWTAASNHLNSSRNFTLSVGTTGNVETGRIEEYWNTGNDNNPQEYHTGSADRTFTRVRSLRFKTDSNGSTPTEEELLNLANWSGTIVAGANTTDAIEPLTIQVNPSTEFIFIIYDAALGPLSSILNINSTYEAINAFTAPQPIPEDALENGGFLYYRSKLPKENQFEYKLTFAN